MLGNFSYCNPTRLYFGEDALDNLGEELAKYGETVLLVYGGGSIKRTGLYDQVVSILKENGKKIVEVPGVMPNPTLEKLAALSSRLDLVEKLLDEQYIQRTADAKRAKENENK